MSVYINVIFTGHTQKSSNTDISSKYPQVEVSLPLGVVAARDHARPTAKWVPLYSHGLKSYVRKTTSTMWPNSKVAKVSYPSL